MPYGVRIKPYSVDVFRIEIRQHVIYLYLLIKLCNNLRISSFSSSFKNSTQRSRHIEHYFSINTTDVHNMCSRYEYLILKYIIKPRVAIVVSRYSLNSLVTVQGIRVVVYSGITIIHQQAILETKFVCYCYHLKITDTLRMLQLVRLEWVSNTSVYISQVCKYSVYSYPVIINKDRVYNLKAMNYR